MGWNVSGGPHEKLGVGIKRETLDSYFTIYKIDMIHSIKKVKQIGNTYHLKLTFENGEERYFDCEPYVWWESFIFWPLKNKETFKLFELKYNTVVWETWADFCPNVLYEKSSKKSLL